MKIWVRMGVTLDITKDEYKAICGSDYAAAQKALDKVIAERRYEPDGDFYIPDEDGEYPEPEFEFCI